MQQPLGHHGMHTEWTDCPITCSVGPLISRSGHSYRYMFKGWSCVRCNEGRGVHIWMGSGLENLQQHDKLTAVVHCQVIMHSTYNHCTWADPAYWTVVQASSASRLSCVWCTPVTDHWTDLWPRQWRVADVWPRQWSVADLWPRQWRVADLVPAGCQWSPTCGPSWAQSGVGWPSVHPFWHCSNKKYTRITQW